MKKNSSIGWIVGGALLFNSMIEYMFKTSVVGNRDEPLSKIYIIEAFAVWACAWIPYVRYVALIIAIPVLAVNVIVKLPIILTGYIHGKGDAQDG